MAPPTTRASAKSSPRRLRLFREATLAQETDLAQALAARIVAAAEDRSSPLVVGLCGPQGSGKSTLAAGLARVIGGHGLSTAVLSIDDLYLSHARRQALAQAVHPLLSVRGPPGTHDVELGLETLDRLAQVGPVCLPRFDKATDDPAAEKTTVIGPASIILFEGWCVGARPQAEGDLADPINALERLNDSNGLWRGYVNQALAGPYQTLFARIDLLVLLQAPNFETVVRWRQEQEHALAARLLSDGSAGRGQAMSDAEVAQFVQYYERLTRHIATEAPSRAHILLTLDSRRQALMSGVDVSPSGRRVWSTARRPD